MSCDRAEVRCPECDEVFKIERPWDLCADDVPPITCARCFAKYTLGVEEEVDSYWFYLEPLADVAP